MASVSAAAARSRDQRRQLLMRSPLLGLDSVGVRPEREALPGGWRWRLDLHFVPPAPGVRKEAVPRLRPRNVRILLDTTPDPSVRVEEIFPGDDPYDLVVVVRTESRGDEEPDEDRVHLLELVDLPRLDPLFSSAFFAFRLGRSRSRIVPQLERQGKPIERTEIDYLAKDYESFRQLLLERMAYYIPAWEERNPSDLGVTLVEVLAYAADYLSYYQDAVATEAYLKTARRRISVRRHTRLLDFRLQEGTNARVWVGIGVASTGEPIDSPRGAGRVHLPVATQLMTFSSRLPTAIEEGSEEHQRGLEEGVLVFQTLYPVTLRPEHDSFDIYTWGAESYSLPREATSAALVGHFPHLAAGDVLVLERRAGPFGKESTEADARGRCAVRLSSAPSLGRDPLTGTEITEITWFDEDALEVELPVSSLVGTVHREKLSVVRGNIVLADHGATVEELLDPVPPRAPYAPVLSRLDLTYRVPFEAASFVDLPAKEAEEQVRWRALPEIELFELPAGWTPASLEEARRLAGPGTPRWQPRFDLLQSDRFARDFVVEIDDDGFAHLRFGDGEAGRRPPIDARFLARYRVGVGPRGNVGAHSVRHVVLSDGVSRDLEARGMAITDVRNHLSGMGGDHPKPAEHARVFAPDILHSFEYQRRCVTERDLVELAERHPEVLKAAARQEWVGSANLSLLFVQRKRGLPLTEHFVERLAAFLEGFLLAGQDVEIRPPRYVPLDIRLTIWLEPGVHEEMLFERFSAEILRPGHRLFDPDQFTFGQPLYLSEVTALVMDIPGVADVRVDTFKRWGRPAGDELETGRIDIGPLEIVRLENDPAAPQHGTLRVRLEESS